MSGQLLVLELYNFFSLSCFSGLQEIHSAGQNGAWPTGSLHSHRRIVVSDSPRLARLRRAPSHERARSPHAKNVPLSRLVLPAAAGCGPTSVSLRWRTRNIIRRRWWARPLQFLTPHPWVRDGVDISAGGPLTAAGNGARKVVGCQVRGGGGGGINHFYAV